MRLQAWAGQAFPTGHDHWKVGLCGRFSGEAGMDDFRFIEAEKGSLQYPFAFV